jgi:hypothetical protein
LGPGHHADLEAHRAQEEALLIKCFEECESQFVKVQAKYSKVTVALFIKTFTKVLSNMKSFEPNEAIIGAYRQRF